MTGRSISFETARHRAKRLKAGEGHKPPAPAAATSSTTRLGYGIQVGNAKTVKRRTARGNVMEVTLMPVPMRKTVRQIMGGRKRNGRGKKKKKGNRR